MFPQQNGCCSGSTSTAQQQQQVGVNVINANVAVSNVTLWQFLLELLAANDHPDLIQWINKNEGEFKLHDAEAVARLWGIRKGKPNMNYDKLSRALRYYYDKNIVKKVVGQKFVYRFVMVMEENDDKQGLHLPLQPDKPVQQQAFQLALLDQLLAMASMAQQQATHQMHQLYAQQQQQQLQQHLALLEQSQQQQREQHLRLGQVHSAPMSPISQQQAPFHHDQAAHGDSLLSQLLLARLFASNNGTAAAAEPPKQPSPPTPMSAPAMVNSPALLVHAHQQYLELTQAALLLEQLQVALLGARKVAQNPELGNQMGFNGQARDGQQVQAAQEAAEYNSLK